MAVRLERLKRRSEFLRVAAARCQWVTPGLVLQSAERLGTGAGTSEFRVGYTASRKVGKAVARNRARRRLRAAAAAVMPEHARPGHDYVVIARRGTLTRPFSRLLGDLRTALGRTATKCRYGARTKAHRGAT